MDIYTPNILGYTQNRYHENHFTVYNSNLGRGYLFTDLEEAKSFCLMNPTPFSIYEPCPYADQRNKPVKRDLSTFKYNYWEKSNDCTNTL